MDKTKEQLIEELEALRQRMAELEKSEAERKRAEEALQESEERYRNLFENAHDMIQSVAPDGHFVFVNRAWLETMGYIEAELPGLNLFKIIHPDSLPHCQEMFSKVMAGESVSNVQATFVAKDGRLILVEGNATGRYIGGRLVATQGIFRDITEREQAEERVTKELTAITAVVNDMLRGEVDDAEMEKRVLDACLAATDSVYGTIGVINEQGKYDTTTFSSRTLQDCAFPEAPAREMSTGMTIRGIWGWPMLHGEPLICNDLKAHPDRIGFPKGHVSFSCFLGVPLKRDEKVVGMVAVADKLGGYTQEDKNTLVRLASTISVSHQHRAALVVAKRISAELEQLVAERTAELKTANEQLRQELAERKQATEALKESEERHRVLVDLGTEVGEAIIMLQDNEQGEGIQTFVSDQWSRITGYSSEELLGMSFFDLVHPRYCQASKERHQRKMQGEIIPKLFEMTIIRKDGTEVPIELTSAYTTCKGNRANVCYIRDITERKWMQEQLITADRLASIGELAAGVAHELNNPLTGVIGFAELLLEKDAPDDIREDIAIIHHEAKRVAEVVKNLLTFARKHPPSKQPVNINTIIAGVLGLRAYEQKVNNIQVITRFTPDLPQIMADHFQLQQVFFNIVTNAEYFMTEAHNKGTLTITTKRVGDVVRVSFADDGSGIRKEDLGYLFDPFFTTKEVGKGTGLGLSICHGIITEHGGTIYAESELGKGATFIVELPVKIAD